ncbi:hypothetical protein MTO96_035314 [Rhipicephalus appendiculatus]
MDKLRRHRGALRGSTTRLLSEASEILLQDTLPSSADLQERIDGLRDKDTALAELDKQIADALDGEEFDAEIVGALEYHERIVKAISRLRSAINARAPVGSTINETNQPRHAEYAVVLHRVLDLAIQYRKRMKTETDVADSVVQSRDEQVKAILKFLQVEVESREESRASREKTTSGRPSTNHKAADTVIPPHLPSALALTARSSSSGAHSRSGPTICPLCGISGHATRDCRVALSAEEKRQRLSSNSSCFSTAGEKSSTTRSVCQLVKGFDVTSTVSPGERKVRRLCDEVAEEDARPTPLSVELVGVVRPVRPSVFREWQLSSLFGKRGDCCHHATRGGQTVRDVVPEVIVRAGIRKWFHFPWTPDEKGAFKSVSSVAGVIGCVGGSVAVIIAPQGDHHKAASYCCKKHYADIVMLVCDVDMGIL